MDIFFETHKGKQFSIEIGYFDTVLEIKEKVHKYHGFPVNQQTLVFNGQVLQDERDVESCELLHNSHLQLIVASDKDNPPQVKIEESSPAKKTQLNIKTPASDMHVTVEMEANELVSNLKEKIHEAVQVPVNRLVLQSSGVELQDHRSLRDCELVDNSEIKVNIRPSPSPSPSPPTPTPTASVAGTVTGPVGSGTGTGTGSVGPINASKKLKLMVLPKCGTKKIPVEVNASDNVGELRKELQKLHQRMHFHLPQEGYFFIYKQNVMDDDRSFRWHHVNQGDTIEIFNGSVTGGS